MKRNVKRILFLSLVAAVTMCFVSTVVAQDKPADNMQILREKVMADKKLLVAESMELTESEAKAFWPVYAGYQDELFLLRSRTAKLIKDYAEAYKDLNKETAKRLLDEMVTIDSLGVELRKAYLPKFRQALPEKKVARYYQLENKIQAALYYELAVQIPLAQ